MIFDQALKDYRLALINLERSPKTIKGYLQELNFWYNWLSEKHNGPIKPSELEEVDVTSFLLWLKIERNYKPSSRRRVAVAIQVFLRWAYQQKIIKQELSLFVPLIKVPQQERAFLSLEQIKTWIDAVDHEVSKMAMWLMYYQGLRISEAINLKMDDIIFTKEGGYINIKNGKGGKHRRLPIAKNLMPILKSYIENKVESDYLLATKKTGRISSVTIQAILRDARRSLNWAEEITSHTLRHSFASHIYKETQDILVVSKLLGHSNLATTQIYAHLYDNQLQKAVDVL